MTSYDEFSPESTEVSTALTPSEKAAAVLLAMGKPVAGKLLKFFEYEELQEIIKKAQNLRTIKPQELSNWSTNSRNLFSEGTGLMDNAKAMEGILEEGLTPDEVDGLLGRRTQFQSYETSIWDRLAGFRSGPGRQVSAERTSANSRLYRVDAADSLCRQDADEAAGARYGSTSCAVRST
jgi:hypothetical protein